MTHEQRPLLARDIRVRSVLPVVDDDHVVTNGGIVRTTPASHADFSLRAGTTTDSPGCKTRRNLSRVDPR